MVFWNDELNAEFRRLRTGPNPISVREMATHFSTTVGAIYAHARLIGCLVMDRHEWTEAEIERLLALDSEGQSAPAIARILGRSNGSVASKLRELMLLGRRAKREAPPRAVQATVKAPPQPKEKTIKPAPVRTRVENAGKEVIDTISAMAAAGKSVADIAAALGRPPNNIQNLAYRLGIKIVRPAETVPDDVAAKLRAGFAAKQSFAQIAKDTGLSPRSIRTQAKRLGIAVSKRRRRRTPDDLETALRQAAAEGQLITAAAHALGCDTRTARRIAEDKGIAFPAPDRRAQGLAGAIVRHGSPRPATDPKPRQPASQTAVPKVRAKTAVSKPRPQRIAAAPKAIAAAALASPKPKAAVVAPGPPTVSATRPVTIAPAPAAPSVIQAEKPAPQRLTAANDSPARRWNAFTPRSGAIRSAADEREAQAAIERFLQTRGVTKVVGDPVSEATNALRNRGYIVTKADKGWLIDHRVALETDQELLDYAERRVPALSAKNGCAA